MRTMILFVLFSIFLSPLAAEARSSHTRSGAAPPRVQEATITLTDKGYKPEKVRLRRGIPARITFVRKVAATCATEVIIEGYNIRRELPLDQPVIVEFTPVKAGEIEYTCSMKMVGGKISIN